MEDVYSWFRADTGLDAKEATPILNERYNDEGWTAALYSDLEALHEGRGGDLGDAFARAQSWFEDARPLEPGDWDTYSALVHIFKDDGQTAKLYQRLVEFNGESESRADA